MEVLKNIFEFFITFGITDTIIIYLFFRKIGKCKENKWYQIIIITLFSSIIKILLPPIFYQIVFMIFLIFYNIIVNKFNLRKSIVIVSLLFVFCLILESIYFFILESCFNIDITKFSDYLELFKFSIVNKIFTIIILLKGEFLWECYGGVQRPKKK